MNDDTDSSDPCPACQGTGRRDPTHSAVLMGGWVLICAGLGLFWLVAGALLGYLSR